MHTAESWTGTFNIVLDDGNTFANHKDNPDMPHDYIDRASGVYCYRSRESAQAVIDAIKKDVVTVIIDGQTKLQGSTPESIARDHFGEKATLLRIVTDNETIIGWNVLEELPTNSANYSFKIIGTMYMYK